MKLKLKAFAIKASITPDQLMETIMTDHAQKQYHTILSLAKKLDCDKEVLRPLLEDLVKQGKLRTRQPMGWGYGDIGTMYDPAERGMDVMKYDYN